MLRPLMYAVWVLLISFSMAFSILLLYSLVISLLSQLESVIGRQFFMSVVSLSFLGISLSSDVLCEGGRFFVSRLWFQASSIIGPSIYHSFLMYRFDMPSGPGVVALIDLIVFHISSKCDGCVDVILKVLLYLKHFR